MWNGQPLKDKTILLWNEQGLGDAIQMIRYVEFFQKRGAKITIGIQDVLVSLFKEFLPIKCEVRSRKSCDIYGYDYHIFLMNLPYILKTELDTIPNQIPYLISKKKVNKSLPKTNDNSYKIGIVWASKKDTAIYLKKSCNLELFVDLLNLGNIELYSLQVGEDSFSKWIIDNGQLTMDRFHDLAPQINDFVDTANFIEQLDLIITVDTAVAHLAAAMGKPTWTLLPFVPDWRWLLERQDSPWYATMRLFRQETRGNWQEVFEEIKDKLAQVLQGENPLFPVENNLKKEIYDDINIIPSKELALQYYKSERIADAIDCYEFLLLELPNDHTIFYNLAILHEKQGKHQKAIELYQKAMEIKPDYTEANHNIAHTLLRLGYWQKGFEQYEWRFKIPQLQDTFSILKFNNIWNGENLNNKSIVLWNEQGLGDAIQMVRYVKLLHQQGAKVIINIQDEFIHLLSKLFEEYLPHKCQTISRKNCDISKYDYHTSLMSLPHKFKTQLDNIPKEIPYLIPSQNINKLLPNLDANSNTYKIGIVWASGKIFQKLYQEKSCHINDFIDLANLGNIDLYSLQVGEDSLSKLTIDNGQLTVDRLYDLAPQINDFADTANFIQQLDLIITVDRAVAHLAGAMGKATWVLLPFLPDWRWLLDRQDSPWYPTMRLFRQKTKGNWQEVFEEVKAQLNQVLQKENPVFPVETISHNQDVIVKEVTKQLELGVSYSQQQQLTQAILCYEKVLDIEPDNVNALHLLGVTYAQQKNFNQGIEFIKKAIEIEPNNEIFNYNLGNVYQENNQIEKALLGLS